MNKLNLFTCALAAVVFLGYGSPQAAQAYVGQPSPDTAPSHVGDPQTYTINLEGGFFYGPGPIEPDLELPPGQLVNVQFNTKTFEGHTPFRNDGDPASILSDGKTRINQNIEAGMLKIGNEKAFLLAAVDGGPNKGKEKYYLAEDYSFNWLVDLALDPGIADAIIRVDDFVLTTGIVETQFSLQTQAGYPGGHDQAGSIASGKFLIGRVGDFNQDGYLDGILVATPTVPLESTMLPGAPVGNRRGFHSNITIEPHLACELTLRNVANFKPAVMKTIKENDLEELGRLLTEMREQLKVARLNLERAIMVGAWKDFKEEGFDLTWHLDGVQMINFIAWAIETGYEYPHGKVSSAVVDATTRTFEQLDKVIETVHRLNERTGDTLPKGKN